MYSMPNRPKPAARNLDGTMKTEAQIKQLEAHMAAEAEVKQPEEADEDEPPVEKKPSVLMGWDVPALST